MKTSNYLWAVLATATLSLSACGSDENENVNQPKEKTARLELTLVGTPADSRATGTLTTTDESQINRYILFRHDFRVLDPSFCYPEGWDHLPFPCVVRIRSKARYLDIPALRKDAPETQLSPAVQRWNHFAMRAARWSQNHLFKKGK